MSVTTSEGAPGARDTSWAERIGALRGWRRLAAAALAGAAMTAGHAPLHLPWGWFVALPVAICLIAGARSPWGAAIVGWAVGFGYLVTGLHWIGHAFLVDAEAFAWMMPIAVTVLPAGLAIFWALAAFATRRIAGRSPLAVAVGLAALLTLAEYARAHVLTGFPWALPGYVWIETPIAQTAAWTGPHGLTLLTLLLTGLPLTALMVRARMAVRCAAGASLIALPVLWVAGEHRLANGPGTAEDAPVLRLVQPNAEQRLKWKREHIPVFYRRLLDGTAAPADPELGPPDAVIWPETAVAFLPADYPEARQQMAEMARGAPLIFGALHRERGPVDQETWSNALMLLGPDGEIAARYDKHHLVPFGEYLPGGDLLRSLGIEALAQRGNFTPGPGPTVIEAPGLPPFVPLICYEAIFPHEVSVAGDRAGWMLQITNDAWFGAFAGPQQHLDQARMRAIEQGLALVRAANTGISAVIDANGRVSARFGLGQHGFFDARLPSAAASTPYARTSDWPALLLATLLIIATIRAQLPFREGRG